MSTTNPDEREARLGMRIRPVVFAAAVLIQFLAPALALFTALGLFTPQGWLIAVYVIVWVVVGLATLWVPSSRNPYILAVLVLAYIAGLFVVIQLVQPAQLGMLGVVFIAVPYAVAAVLVVLYLLREAAIRRTREIGVDTTAEVMSAAVTGMVNYVTRQRLTLRFTDQQGVDRFVRVGRTGGGYSTGDTIPMRYDPTRPWSTRGVLVDGSGPTLFGGRR
jgi:hypothetical protein